MLASKPEDSPMEMREPKTFVEFLHLRFTGRDKLFFPGDKLAVFALIRSMGFNTAENYKIFDCADDISLSKLPNVFVIKPHQLSSKRGVYVLHRIAGDCGYWDAMTNKRFWASQIVDEFSRLEKVWKEKRTSLFKIIAEERVVGEYKPNGIPLDYKFYAFNGRVRFILQIDRNFVKPRLAFFGEDFSPWNWMDFLSVGKSVEIGLPVIPSQANEMLDIVINISKNLNTPFCSVDMYQSKRGPLVGELTRTPGGPYFGMFKFNNLFDQELGDEWRRAALELNQPIGQIGTTEKIPTVLKNRVQ